MKKVLVIIGKLYIGGAERVARDIGYHADPARYSVHYLVFGDEVGDYERELEARGCVIHHVPSPTYGHWAYYRNVSKLIKTYRYDVIHCHTMFSSGWAVIAGRRGGVPVRIAHSHTTKAPVKRGVVKCLYETVMRQVIIKNATHLVACGAGAGEWFYGADVFRKRGLLIYNGIGLAEFVFDREAREKLRTEYGLRDRFVIGHVGHLAAVKNQVFLIERMPQILSERPEAFLLLLGDGPDRDTLQQRIRELHLEDYVLLTGNVTNVGAFMSAMDVFAFPSLYEGMPLAMVEAQTSGLPCCVSDRVPGDIYLTDLVQVLPLEQPEVWITAICGCRCAERETYGRRMADLGLDTSGMLDKIYALYEGGQL